jgi:hypothetical protein
MAGGPAVKFYFRFQFEFSLGEGGWAASLFLAKFNHFVSPHGNKQINQKLFVEISHK